MQHPTSPAPAPEPRTAPTWRCTGCDTYVANTAWVCTTCGVDRQGNDTYDYATDPRSEHPVRVVWRDDEITDAVRADSPTEALEAARANWPGATVALVEQTLDRSTDGG
ncbi:hypothetical protein NE857_34005 (plasmid) [Nocardiopsis exhalans]|uniref:RanBP2-type domain-containing protein n=1 Tax=Nocardiopsis exhalans TaxID=163604 RepID=A0ABY5DJT1_9ACTN|nr:hypothetical protein [Nocardiopsis exhalans]USY23548.1 hypothetical protein NE857_34005 [Nocardiopsis exhalans]